MAVDLFRFWVAESRLSLGRLDLTSMTSNAAGGFRPPIILL